MAPKILVTHASNVQFDSLVELLRAKLKDVGAVVNTRRNAVSVFGDVSMRGDFDPVANAFNGYAESI